MSEVVALPEQIAAAEGEFISIAEPDYRLHQISKKVPYEALECKNASADRSDCVRPVRPVKIRAKKLSH